MLELEEETFQIPIYTIGRVSTGTETKLSFKTGGYIEALYVDEGDYVRKGKMLAQLQTTEIDAQVNKTRRALEKAMRDLERFQSMLADSIATLENVQDLTTQVEIAKADLEIAQFNQGYSKIVAPVSGRVVMKLSEKK